MITASWPIPARYNLKQLYRYAAELFRQPLLAKRNKFFLPPHQKVFYAIALLDCLEAGQKVADSRVLSEQRQELVRRLGGYKATWQYETGEQPCNRAVSHMEGLLYCVGLQNRDKVQSYPNELHSDVLAVYIEKGRQTPP